MIFLSYFGAVPVDAEWFETKRPLGVVMPKTPPHYLQSDHIQSATRYNQFMSNTTRKRLAWFAIALLVLALLSILAFKFYKIYTLGQRTYADIQHLQSLPRASISDPATALELGNTLASLQTDLILIDGELQPFYPVTRNFTWLPRFSTEVVYAEQLIDTGIALLDTGRYALQAAVPAFELISDPMGPSLLTQIPALLDSTTAPIDEAALAFDRFQTIRAQLPVNQLDPFTKSVFTRIDDLTPTLTSAFDFYPEAPALLGMSSSQVMFTSFKTPLDNSSGATYLLIFQNQDELRATGGFVTAIGSITLKDGKPTLGTFTDSPTQDDLTKIYPPPPWWLKKYMRSDYLLLRDANWEIDYPQAALSMASLYGYYDPTPLSGVISIDQQAIVALLRFTGPLDVPGFDQPVSADNLIDQLRAAKSVDAAAFGGESGQRKAFLAPIAAELMQKLLSMMDAEHAKDLYSVVSRALDQKQILISFFTPGASAFMAERGWNGAVSAVPNSDTLMVVDSNIGFNKTNALISRAYTYSVNLTSTANPTAELTIIHTHNGDSEYPCQQWGAENQQSIRQYPMERCYYNYLRVVTNENTQLVGSQTHPVSGLLIGGVIPAQVDDLTDRLDGARVWGTLMALPGHENLTNSLKFALPADVVTNIPVEVGQKVSPSFWPPAITSESEPAVTSADDTTSESNYGYANDYQLTLFKQPGAHPEEVTIIIQLPLGSELLQTNLPNNAALQTTQDREAVLVTITFLLEQDELIQVVYR